MSLLVLNAYVELLRCGAYVSRRDFAGLYQKVRRSAVRPSNGISVSCAQVCHAVDVACMWYWKQVQCLQRSAATTCLLRRHGTAAEMVIASRRMPFQAHAWVEVEGRVVNDRPQVRETYAVLDRL